MNDQPTPTIDPIDTIDTIDTTQLPIIRITHHPLDAALIERLTAVLTSPGDGGVVTFLGVVRDNAHDKRVRYLEYDAYVEMAEDRMRAIAAEIQQRWGVSHLAIIHRIGRLEISECSVIVIVASPHRAEAFDACRYAIDTLKTTVPIWKKEVAEDGESWIES